MIVRRPAGILGAALLTAACSTPAPQLPEGAWRGWLDSPGGELPFGIELTEEAGRLRAFLINGVERLPVARVERVGNRFSLDIEHYDSTLVGELSDDLRQIDGVWTKTAGPGRTARLAFHARAGALPRFAVEPGVEPAASVAGRWAVTFDGDGLPAVAVFEQDADGTARGTFMTTTGDYRYLAGRVDGGRLRLSCFDGAHAFLFDARVQPDGSLAGDFWSRDTWHETWTARPDPGAELPDAFELTRWMGNRGLESLSFPDLEGQPRTLDDPAFHGKARILVLFGSWCPNCNDATDFLVELDRRYRDRGLSILGLAFEMTGDFERDARQVRTYAEHHGARYPMLIAGVADKDEASASFPLVDRVRSFPTTIFLDRDGRARAVHQGYTGPAAGENHRDLRRRFEELVESLLAESDGP